MFFHELGLYTHVYICNHQSSIGRIIGVCSASWLRAAAWDCWKSCRVMSGICPAWIPSHKVCRLFMFVSLWNWLSHVTTLPITHLVSPTVTNQKQRTCHCPYVVFLRGSEGLCVVRSVLVIVFPGDSRWFLVILGHFGGFHKWGLPQIEVYNGKSH